MKHRWLMFCRHLPWLLLLLGIDGLGALLLWLADADAFYVLAAVIFLSTVLLFTAVLAVLIHREQKRTQAFRAFLANPNDYQEEKLRKAVSASEAEEVRLLGSYLREKQLALSRAGAELLDYEEYVEVWAHETKTPLSLLTLVLDNRGEEIPDPIRLKLNHIRNQMQEYVNQMLYYARLKGTQKDYLFEQTDIRACIEEVLSDYQLLLEEKQFRVCNQVPHVPVFTDRRGIQFLLGQLISNAVKYSAEEPELTITWDRSGERDILRIRDNGTGVRSCDLPYIFEKGFTGNSAGGSRKATGMGLYLSQKMAEDLNLSLEAKSQWGGGFEMAVSFPRVEP